MSIKSLTILFLFTREGRVVVIRLEQIHENSVQTGVLWC